MILRTEKVGRRGKAGGGHNHSALLATPLFLPLLADFIVDVTFSYIAGASWSPSAHILTCGAVIYFPTKAVTSRRRVYEFTGLRKERSREFHEGWLKSYSLWIIKRESGRSAVTLSVKDGETRELSEVVALLRDEAQLSLSRILGCRYISLRI